MTENETRSTAMDPEELFPKRRKSEIVIGEDLALLSVAELRERIDLLGAEIERLKAAIASKESSRAAADAVFGRSAG
jgi:uncharacterized small protein (DUF1192 family)